MLPVIAILGRPNVGKSTLFNQLTRSRDALVADHPGLTRDRRYGIGRIGPEPFVVIDTGGLGEGDEGLAAAMARQSLAALAEADAAVVLVDAREGMSAGDAEIVEAVRRSGKPVRLAVNKTEGLDREAVLAEFHELGLGRPAAVAAKRGQGVAELIADLLAELPPAHEDVPVEADGQAIRLAVIGRPNVGKSTLINRILGEERVVVFDTPGTTRDTIPVPFRRDGQDYVLVDTAGIRRRSRVDEAIEKFSVVKTLQAIEDAHVVVLVVDAREGVTEQDASIAGLALQRGRAMVLAVNKWDGLHPDQKDTVRRQLDVRLPFLSFVPLHMISALHGTGVGELFESVSRVYEAATRDLPTPELTRILQDAVAHNPPPLARGRRIKLRYAHQGGRGPPVIVIHGTQAGRLPATYRRYLENTFRDAFDLEGTPVRIELRSPENPYAGRPSRPAGRQTRKRQRGTGRKQRRPRRPE